MTRARAMHRSSVACRSRDVKPADWEGNALRALGLRARPGRAARRSGRCRTSPPSAPASQRATASSRSTARRCARRRTSRRVTNATAGRAARVRESSATGAARDIDADAGSRRAGTDARSAIAGLRLQRRSGSGGAARDHRSLRVARRARAGRAQDVGAVGVHAADAGPHRHRRRVA